MVGAQTIHFVDERQPRHPVAVRLVPHGFGLRLHPFHRRENRHRAIQNAQRAFHLNGEVHVAGGVDDGDLMPLPVARRCRGADRDAAFPFLLHPVHHRLPVVYLAELVRQAGIEEDALRYGRFAGIDVGNDPDVAPSAKGSGYGVRRHGRRSLRLVHLLGSASLKQGPAL